MTGTFVLLAVWLNVLCLQLILTYYKQLSTYLEGLNEWRFDEILRTVHRMEHLQRATKIVNQQFGFMLMTNCCFALITMINSSYYTILYGKLGNNLIVIVWESFTVLEVFSRLLLHCEWADRTRSAVSSNYRSQIKSNYGNITLGIIGNRNGFPAPKVT